MYTGTFSVQSVSIKARSVGSSNKSTNTYCTLYRYDALTSWPIVDPNPLQREASAQGRQVPAPVAAVFLGGVTDDLVLGVGNGCGEPEMAAVWWTKKLRVDAQPAPCHVHSGAAP